jgi:site-specific recombinase XerD
MSTVQLCRLDLIFEEQLQAMGATLRPRTIKNYRVHINRLLRYLRLSHPDLHSPGQLQRIHILGWLSNMADGPLCNDSRRSSLIHIRRLLEDLADNGYPIADKLIFPHDLPPRDQHLPKPVSPEVDRRLNNEMRKTDDLVANALLLMRATGIRVGECLSLTRDGLRHLGQRRWALHVPIGKLHNERWVPMDDDGCKIFNRILSLAGPAPTGPSSPLLLLPNGKRVSYDRIYHSLRDTSQRAGCPHIRPHQLRHTFATALVRAGISLPALKAILGHRDIRMTLTYIQVTQNDLQREYHQARQKMAAVHVVPLLPNRLDALQTANCEISAICGTLDALRHQLEMYRRHLHDQCANRKLHSLDRRIAKIRKSLMEIKKT